MTRREQDLLSAASITTFKLNGQFLVLAEELARPAGLTAAWWQVLGAVLGEPLPVAGIAREMGVARQSVQRVADILVERGLAEYRDNPAHRRARTARPYQRGARRNQPDRPGTRGSGPSAGSGSRRGGPRRRGSRAARSIGGAGDTVQAGDQAIGIDQLEPGRGA